jgi:hypothetical protein
LVAEWQVESPRVKTIVDGSERMRGKVDATVVVPGGIAELDGPIAGGLTGFFQLQKISSFENYEDQMLAGGFRYEV